MKTLILAIILRQIHTNLLLGRQLALPISLLLPIFTHGAKVGFGIHSTVTAKTTTLQNHTTLVIYIGTLQKATGAIGRHTTTPATIAHLPHAISLKTPSALMYHLQERNNII